MLKKSIFILIILSTLFTPIIYADDQLIDSNLSSKELNETIETSINVETIPTINARHAIILDRNSKIILCGKKEKEICKMASTTKIMTAIVVIENANLTDTITVSSKAARTGGSRLGLSTGNTITVENLLYGLMLRSGNDAAVALAEYVSGSVESFAELMNNKANELGLTNTHFVTPHGLDNNDHYSTAYDLAILTDYALTNKIFSKIVKTKTYTITLNGYSKTLSNTNELLGNLDGVYGVKTGFTNGANRCLITSCKRGDLDIICVVLGCDTKKDRTKDSIKLINYTFNNFTIVNIKEIIKSEFETWYTEHANSFIINKGINQLFELKLDDNDIPYSLVAINNADKDKITTSICFESYYEAPVPSSTTIGTLSLLVNNNEYFNVDIINSNEISKKTISDYFAELISNYCNYLTLKI